MKYVIVRVDDSRMVARPGSRGSYTRDPSRARVFESREAAEKERCGNEGVVNVLDLFGRP